MKWSKFYKKKIQIPIGVFHTEYDHRYTLGYFWKWYFFSLGKLKVSQNKISAYLLIDFEHKKQM